MSLSDLASIGSLISGVAVLISLVYLSLQVKQAERNQQAAIRAARTSRIVEIFMGLSDPALADAVSRATTGDVSATDTQIHQFLFYCGARFMNAEDSFYQYREGLLNEFTFDGIVAGLKASLGEPGVRAYYRRNKYMFGKEFGELLDRLLAETHATARLDAATQWRKDVAAELDAA